MDIGERVDNLMDELLSAATVPEELVPRMARREGPFTYDDLMDVLQRVYDNPYGGAPDVFEDERREDETRAQAKSRIMLEHYSLQGRPPRDKDLWELRARYLFVREFVQIDGRPYSTHNPLHFANRYGMNPANPAQSRVEVLMVGLWRETPAEMMRYEARENGARLALRLLS